MAALLLGLTYCWVLCSFSARIILALYISNNNRNCNIHNLRQNNNMVCLHGQTPLTFRRSISKVKHQASTSLTAAVAGQTQLTSAATASANGNDCNVKQSTVAPTRFSNIMTSSRTSSSSPQRLHRPPDPKSILNPEQLEEKAQQLLDWLSTKRNVFCLSGAGLSTDSGIPDYRGYNGSYHRGHKPIIHQQFIESEYQRKRYWGRGMIGWKHFDTTQPNKGHIALAKFEKAKMLGVTMEDLPEFYDPIDKDEYLLSSGQRKLSILTQNVDTLHQRAGSTNVLQIHGNGKIVKCMNCSYRMNRNKFHEQLESLNIEWLQLQQQQQQERANNQQNQMRPDGDAQLREDTNYGEVQLPSCPQCHTGFMKPDVVFFGDTVPKHRVAICQQAVENADGILVVGTSLAVHSAYRHIRQASQNGIPVAILNVGETRAETEQLTGIMKIEAPIGDTLHKCDEKLTSSSKDEVNNDNDTESSIPW